MPTLEETLLAAIPPDAARVLHRQVAEAVQSIYGAQTNTQTGNIDSTYANGPSFAKSDSFGGSVTLDWQVADNMKFKSITGWRQITWNIGTDLDGTPESMQEVTDSQKQHQVSQEFQLNGNGEYVLRKASAIAPRARRATRRMHPRVEAQMRRRAAELLALLRGLD